MLEGFGLLCGHLLGDYLLQNDWMAANKTNPLAGFAPKGFWVYKGSLNYRVTEEWLHEKVDSFKDYDAKVHKESIGHVACTIHCLIYTLSVYLCSYHWMPWWGLLVCFLAHWPIDRFRLAKIWMNYVGQKAFASGPLSPWSIIVVDNTFHLLTLYVIAFIHFS